ncbi:hypothetical protein Pelo_17713 [Pelomyxa schiedti]|nr:hypothetical protein Pelo_17713 [Pelomyxa schiedti]
MMRNEPLAVTSGDSDGKRGTPLLHAQKMEQMQLWLDGADIPIEKPLFDKYVEKSKTLALCTSLQEFNNLTPHHILHVSNVHDAEDTTLRAIFTQLDEIRKARRATVIISGLDATITGRTQLLFTPILTPIITPEVAFQILKYFLSMVPGESLLGSTSDQIVAQMRILSGCLYGPPYVIKRFLEIVRVYSLTHHERPFLLTMIIQVWLEAMQKYDSLSCMQYKHVLNSSFKNTLNKISHSDEVLQLRKNPWSQKLLDVGSNFNTKHFCCIIPQGDSIRVYIPFSFTACCTLVQGSVLVTPTAEQLVDQMMKSQKGNEFEIVTKRALTEPGSILLCRTHLSTSYHSHFNLRAGYLSFDSLAEAPLGRVLVVKVGFWKVDTCTSETKGCVDVLTLAQNDEDGSSILHQYKITTASTGLDPKILEFFQAGSDRDEDAIYTFISAVEYVPQPDSEVAKFLSRDPHSDGKHLKKYQILSGPTLVSQCPEAFLHCLIPPGAPYRYIPDAMTPTAAKKPRLF